MKINLITNILIITFLVFILLDYKTNSYPNSSLILFDPLFRLLFLTFVMVSIILNKYFLKNINLTPLAYLLLVCFIIDHAIFYLQKYL